MLLRNPYSAVICVAGACMHKYNHSWPGCPQNRSERDCILVSRNDCNMHACGRYRRSCPFTFLLFSRMWRFLCFAGKIKKKRWEGQALEVTSFFLSFQILAHKIKDIHNPGFGKKKENKVTSKGKVTLFWRVAHIFLNQAMVTKIKEIGTYAWPG